MTVRVTAVYDDTQRRRSTVGKGTNPMSKPFTVNEFCAQLGVSRSTFYEWRAKGKAPRCIKLPNGEIRISHAEFDRWISGLEEAA